MAAIKQKCKQFYYNWTKFNKGYLDVNPNSFQRPTVLVVADEVFQMADKLLRQPAKSAIPNTLAECNLLDGRHRNLEFQKKQKQLTSAACDRQVNNVKFKLSGDADNLTKEFMLQEKSR